MERLNRGSFGTTDTQSELQTDIIEGTTPGCTAREPSGIYYMWTELSTEGAIIAADGREEWRKMSTTRPILESRVGGIVGTEHDSMLVLLYCTSNNAQYSKQTLSVCFSRPFVSILWARS